MTRITNVVVACLLVIATSARSLAEERRDQIIALYEAYALKAEDEIIRCSRLLNSLFDAIPKAANESMQHEKCSDEFSGFDEESGSGKKVSYNSDAQLRLFGTVLDIRVAHFDIETGTSLKKQVSAMTRSDVENIRTVVLDLRGDLGGSVLGARDFLEVFAPKEGLRYLQAQSRCPDVAEYQVTKGRGELAGKRYILLVNGKTASASEIVLTTLRFEWYPDTTTVVGIDAYHTYGKAFMQWSSDALAFSVTCGKWQVAGKYPLLLGIGVSVDKAVINPTECQWQVDCLVRELTVSAALPGVDKK